MRFQYFAAMAAGILIVSIGLASTHAEAPPIPPLPIDPGSYVTLEVDGTHPYGESHGLEVGLDVTFSHFEECTAVYVTKTWQRPLGGGAKVYGQNSGEITVDLCEGPVFGSIVSASTRRVGELVDLGGGEYLMDFSDAGGNTRIMQYEP